MEKLHRSERMALLAKILSDSPGKVFTLGHFADKFGAAKSSISEDINILENTFKSFGQGIIKTIPGPSGGVMLIPSLSKERTAEVLEALCSELSKKGRMLAGGYIYTLDQIFDPSVVSNIGCIFASRFYESNIDYVVTVETKGIPLAFITAKYMNVPLIIVRHHSEATDGASVNINYISGYSKKVQTMVLSIKALKRNSRLLFIDDFMKGGGTAKGIIELAKEFECEVPGIGVLIKTAAPEKKLVDDYFSLLTLESVNEESGIISISPSIDSVW